MERDRKLFSVKMRSSKGDIHISGAEAIVTEERVEETILSFLRRAREHERGEPDFINLKVEEIKEEPVKAPLLPVFHVQDKEGEEALREVLKLSPIPVELGLKVYNQILESPKSMRGAMVVEVPTGKRLEEDRERGIRVSYIGISEETEQEVKKRSGKYYTRNLKEALVIATKVCLHKDVLGELCISDNPSYTTGYLAIRGKGYFRIFNIKKRGMEQGGRTIFVKEGCNVEELKEFLEKKPFIASGFGGYFGFHSSVVEE